MSRTVTDDQAAQIIRTIDQRMNAQSPLIRQMWEVQKRYDGNVVVIPMPDVEGSPNLPKATPLLIANAIDDVALAAASTMPMVHVPPFDPTKAKGKHSVEFARIHRRALDATGRKNHLNLQMRRAFRQMTGYATWSQVVLPTDYGPCIELREPLATYPDPKAPEDPSPPTDVAFLYLKSASWVRYEYPETRRENGGPVPPPSVQMDQGQQWVLFEWIDHEKAVLGLLAPAHMNQQVATEWLGGQLPWRILGADDNRLDYVPAIVPRRASMSGIASQMSQLTGLADLMDKLMALEIVAQEKSVFPDRYIIAQEGRIARVEGGSWKDGRLGETNIVYDASSIGELRAQPDQGTGRMIDRMERNFSRSAGVMPQQRGETFGALRTGRALDTMFGVSIDPRVQEVHEIAEASLSYLYRAITDTYKAYYGSRTFSMLAGRQADVSVVKFTPETHMEHSEVAVSYAIPGASAEQLTVALGMLTQAELIGKKTARQLHPWVADPEAEEYDIVAQQLDEAMLQGVIKGVMTTTEPGMSPALLHAARIKELVLDGMPLDQAIKQAWKDVQAEQAEAVDEPEMPGMMPPPGAMPGLAGLPGPGGGMVPPAGLPPGQPPPPPEQGVGQMLAAMGQAPPAA